MSETTTNKKYLDKDGLTYFWKKIADADAAKADKSDLANYTTTEALDTKLGSYTTTEALETKLGSYATTEALETKANTADLANKVDKADGKGLSTEDFTTELKTKLSDTNLKAITDIVHEDGQIKLKFGDKTFSTGISDADFIKDGMLTDVSIVTPNELAKASSSPVTITYKDIAYTSDTEKGDVAFIQFLWDLDGTLGEEVKKDYLKVDEIGATYTSSDSIDISKTNVISVKNVGTDKTTIKEKIPVAGGPLAGLLNDAGIKEINPNDTANMQALLVKLFCKEEFVDSITTTDATLVSKVDAPTIDMSTSTVEVGTPVSYTVTNGASSYTATPHKASGFKYGYSSEDNDIKEHEETSVSATFGPVSVASDTSTLTISGAAKGTAEGTSAASSATLTGTITPIKPGTSTLSASNTSATYTGTCPELPVYYACSNLEKTDTSHVSKLKESATLTSNSTSNSTSKSFESKYKYFVGVYSTVYSETQYNSDFIRNNVDKYDWMNGTSVNITVPTEVGTKGMYIAIPEGVDDTGATLKVIQTTALNADASKDITKNVRTVSVKCGGDHSKNYKVFTWDFPGGTEGIEKFDITKF